MRNSQAKQIVSDLLQNPDLYRQKSQQEGEIWGKIFSDRQFNEITNSDREAAKQLNFNRDHLSPISLLKKHGISPQNGLSLACGSGRAERQYLKAKICQKFHGIDISHQALEEARTIAAKQNLNITYEQGDLNEIFLPTNTYDLVITQNCLHHVLKLERLAEQIHNSMTADGVLWIHDYIGESQFQYSEERLEWINSILSILPERMITNKLNGKVVKKVELPQPGKLVSPFESIRSDEIIPIFLEKFDVIEKAEFNSVLRLIMPLGAKSEYLKNEESRVIFELLWLLDRMLIDKNILPPTGCQYLLKPKTK
jgi:SAM-dependent methyltransferase